MTDDSHHLLPEFTPQSTPLAELAGMNDPTMINGVYVPMDILIQLREAGYAASELLRGELQEAKGASRKGRVFGEVGGDGFLDCLEESADEEVDGPDAGDDDEDDSPNTDEGVGEENSALPKGKRARKSFVQQIKDEREAQKEGALLQHAQTSGH